ncbi:MAG: hypothetical protein AAGI45_01625 [Cyanobacteria bacterium P01_H01_bin.26]
MGFLRIRPFVALSVCLVLGAASCSRFGERTKDVIDAISIQNLSNGRKLLENEDRGVQLTVGDGWNNVQDLRPDADLYVAHEDREMYVLVLADARRSEVGNFDLADNSATYRRILAGELSQVQPQAATGVTSVNGLDAVQYEVRGRVDNVPIVYLHTTVEGDVNYYQVVAWTTAEDYSAARPELQAVIESFRGI